jgi:hypothetical protein
MGGKRAENDPFLYPFCYLISPLAGLDPQRRSPPPACALGALWRYLLLRRWLTRPGGESALGRKEVIMTAEEQSILINLVNRWEDIARRKWTDSEVEDDPMGKKLIEHGALCYQNCARELKEALTSSLPLPLTTQGEL